MFKTRQVIILVSFMFIFAATGLFAAEPQGQHSRLYIFNQAGGRINPEGAADTMELHYQYNYSDSNSILFKNNNIGFGISETISPATNAIGAFVEIEPIAVFRLRVQYEYLSYFGAFTALMSFPSKNSDYSDSVLDDMQDDELAHWAVGTHFFIQPTFQIQIKRFIAMNTASFEWFDVDREGYFYEPTNDTLMKTEDYFFLNNAVVGYELWKKDDNTRMIFGVRHEYFHVQATDIERQDVAGALVWMMGNKIWFMEKPMLMVAIGGYPEDRYREKDAFVGVMFSSEYTLWPKGGR